jgi:hypothetical protein
MAIGNLWGICIQYSSTVNTSSGPFTVLIFTLLASSRNLDRRRERKEERSKHPKHVFDHPTPGEKLNHLVPRHRTIQYSTSYTEIKLFKRPVANSKQRAVQAIRKSKTRSALVAIPKSLQGRGDSSVNLSSKGLKQKKPKVTRTRSRGYFQNS